MDPTINTDIQTVLTTGVFDIRPNVGEMWELTLFGSSLFSGVAPFLKPDMNVGLYDAAGLGPGNFMRGDDLRGWYRTQRLIIDRDHFVRVTNVNAATANLSYSAKLVRSYGAAPTPCRSDIQTVLAGATVDIRPAAGSGECWLITDIGSDQWVGAKPAGLPDIMVDLNDGTNTARIMRSADNRQWEGMLKLYVDRDNYVTITNTSANPATISWSAELIRQSGTGITVVRSDVQVCATAGNIDFRPNVGEEWEISIFGGSVWVGAAPNGFPDLTAHMFDNAAAIASQIAGETSWPLQGHLPQLLVDRDNYLRLTDIDTTAHGLGQNVGISAVLTGQFA